ncbi:MULTISPECIES: universal stress protein [Streptomycetaceae]|uniref:Universal stress protein UspA and related nucleotide-binding protein-like protein n=1 Tax=Streptantibioticus cattleyicolor (strain ATCC 35852 / DSM 46488 / JCM 4925 / NBRC 14057 / NRRL 8057) TaxID=1003195 RepID=F8JSZ7_STREN|nr:MULTISPECIES: universal stress protein [Streptomycetaceae]AEW98071.1 Universal stress protein UspA and related nucleotide-binding protein-like protein [Streptantibioticus cattleyicolor NRRL 8057 = DSM 46488]MYS62465.1 universal stress protein [Streptomyces sp. SID5468]CCB78387.1 Universal stress protein UspA-like protein [Streptantibioticus cattleyicolor NRRL 8057 = DSM 46488]
MDATGPAREVVVGVDGSADSERAADWAASEARRRGCRLRVLHATGTGPEPPRPAPRNNGYRHTVRAARALLDDARHRVAAGHPGLCVETTLTTDDPEGPLLAAAEGAELLVLGTRGRGGFSTLLLGSVGLRVASHVTCPLVVVRGRAVREPARRVVAGVQDVRDAEAVLFAAETAARWRAGLLALHAWEPVSEVGHLVPRVDTVRELRHEHVRSLLQSLTAAEVTARVPGLRVEREVVDGGAAAALVDASARADLLVVAAHRPRTPTGLRLGPVAHAVLHHARCPVAVVPDR